MRKINLYIFMFVFFVACKPNKEYKDPIQVYLDEFNNRLREVDLFQTIKHDVVTIDYVNAKEVSSKLTNVSIIKLETTEESIIGEVSKLELTNFGYLIFDNNTNSIFKFSNEGKFIAKIKRIGKGPDEYMEIHDMVYDEVQNQIVVFDNIAHKIISYDGDGKFIRSQHTGFFIAEMELINDTLVAFTNNKNKSGYNLVFLNKSDYQIIGKAISDNGFNPAMYPITTSFRSFNGKLSFMEPFEEYYYEIQNNELKIKYQLLVDHENLSRFYQGPAKLNVFVDDLLKNSSVFILGDHIENDNCLIIQIMKGNEKGFITQELFYDKTVDKAYKFNLRYNQSNIRFPISQDEDGFFIALLEPDYVLKNIESFKDIGLEDLKLNSFDNPMLLRFKLEVSE